MINERYNMKLNIITPIHIGDGNGSLSKLEYSYNNGKLSIIDQVKFMDLLKREGQLGNYINYVERVSSRNERANLYYWLKDNIRRLDANMIIRDIAKYTIQIKVNDRKSLNDIKGCIKSMGNPYIPGSSIKGAIRTAILYKFIFENPNKFINEVQEIKYLYKEAKHRGFYRTEFSRQTTNLFTNLEKNVFRNQSDSKSEISGMSGISISDSSFAGISNLKAIQKIDYLVNKDDYNDIPVIYECLGENTILDFDIDIDTRKTAVSITTKNILTANDIVETIKFQTDKVFDRSNGVWGDFDNFVPWHRVDDNINLMFLGGNTGFIAHTLIHALFKDKNERVEIISGLLHEKFRKAKHLADKPHSPRTIHVYDSEETTYYTGLCQIYEVK